MLNLNQIIQELQENNDLFVKKNGKNLKKHIKGQNPKIAILTCSDSRVIPEYIFNKGIGELFVIRVAGNIAIDSSVIISLEYAVDHLKIPLIIIMGHTYCGVVYAAENCSSDSNELLNEIKSSFSIDKNHILSNLKRQIEMLPKRSNIIFKALEDDRLKIIGAVYHLENGNVEFL